MAAVEGEARPVYAARFFSDRAKLWTTDFSFKCVPLGNVDLSAGLPHRDAMPFRTVTVTCSDGTVLHLDEKAMDRANQYPPFHGFPELRDFIRELLIRLHDPPGFDIPSEKGGRDIILLSGNTEAYSRTFDMVVNVGDYVLVEEPIYNSVKLSIENVGGVLLGVEVDSDGLVPDSLRRVLSRWSPEDTKNPKSDIPKLLYTVTNSSNPSGVVTTLDRRKEIYQICRQYDVLILEDDPYYFMVFEGDPLPSYLSLDVDGRVIRCDTFSKVLAPGYRVSFVCGEPMLMRKLHDMSILQTVPSGLSQAVYVELIKQWGLEGYLKHTKWIAKFYREKRDKAIEIAERHLKGLAEWSVPKGGMFLWMKIKGLEDVDRMHREALKRKVQFRPGSTFMVDSAEVKSYIRISFSSASAEDLEKGFKILAEIIQSMKSNNDVKNT